MFLSFLNFCGACFLCRLLTCRCGVRRGACFVCRLPTLPLVYFLAPYPPSPRSQSALPRWGRGRPRLFHARGFAPCIPATEPVRTGEWGRITLPAGGVPLRGTCSPCRCGKLNGGLAPARHLLSLPRGRGPSQTPPSLATDSSISPGPPSPWLPALLIGNRFLAFLRRTMGSVAGMQGAKPLA